MINSQEKQLYVDKVISTLVEYATNRMKEVKKNKETAEFAAILVEKFGFGLGEALSLLNLKSDFFEKLDKLLLDIDPDFEINRKKRWSDTQTGLLHINS